VACLVFDVATAMGLVLPVRAAKKDSDTDTLFDPCGTAEPKCTGKFANSHIAFPEDCTKYLRCTGSRLHVESCPAGQSFDNISRECVPETQDFQCQSPCPGGIYHKYLTTTSSAVPVRRRPITPTVGHVMTTARLTHAVTTTSQPLSSQTTTSSSHPRPDSLSTLTTESSTAFQTSASSPPTQQVTSVRHDASTSYSHVSGMTSTSAAHAQQTTSGGSASSRVTTTARDVTEPRDDVMPGTLI